MEHHDAPLQYQDILEAFEKSLHQALLGKMPPPVTDLPLIPLMLTLLDVTYAVRESRPTHELVTRAREEFKSCTDNLNEKRWWTDDFGIDPW